MSNHGYSVQPVIMVTTKSLTTLDHQSQALMHKMYTALLTHACANNQQQHRRHVAHNQQHDNEDSGTNTHYSFQGVLASPIFASIQQPRQHPASDSAYLTNHMSKANNWTQTTVLTTALICKQPSSDNTPLCLKSPSNCSQVIATPSTAATGS